MTIKFSNFQYDSNRQLKKHKISVFFNYEYSQKVPFLILIKYLYFFILCSSPKLFPNYRYSYKYYLLKNKETW